MAAKTYNPVQSDYKFVDIIEYILQQTGPVSGTAIAKGLGMAHASVMSHLTVAVERKWIKETNGQYEAGLRLLGMYSAYKMGLVNKIESIQNDLKTLEA